MKPPYDSESPLAWENYVVAQTAFAMIGLLGSGVRAVACRFLGEEVELHFAVPEVGEVEREDIEDIGFELDVLLEGGTPIGTVIHEGVETLDWGDRSLRAVYGAKPMAEDLK